MIKKMIPHVLGCSCDKCILQELDCPFCKWIEIGGQYSTTSPYEWYWWVGTGDQPVSCEYCGNCGKKLPDHGIHPMAQDIMK